MRLRFLQVMFGAIFGGVALVALILSIANKSAAALPAVLVPGFIATVAVLVFEVQIRGLRAKGRAVRENIEAIAAKVFDAPGVVQAGYDMSVTSGALGASMSALENDVGFTADGTHGGVRVSAASHASTLGRQIGEFSHVYSHVVVDMRGLEIPFRLSKEGVGSALVHVTGLGKDVPTGDAAFDKVWNVNADEGLARDVLTDSIRTKLMELKAGVSSVSQDFGVGTMSVILTRHGLAIRWPGPIDPAFAVYLRDLLLEMRTRILAYVDRQAARGGAADGYRVIAEPAPGAEPLDSLPTEAEEKSRLRS